MRALESYHILDTAREQAFDDIVALASALLQTPIAVVNFVGSDRQWFKAEVGIGCSELPIDDSICRFAILQPGVFVIPDLTRDARFDCNPLVHVEGGLRFYAGALLQSADGQPIGTVCVLDHQPRPDGITDWQRKGLEALASQVMRLLEHHVAARHQQFLMDVTQSLQSETSARALVEASVAALTRHLAIARAGFCHIDGGNETDDRDLVLGESHDGRAGRNATRLRLRHLGAALADDILAGRTTVVEDAAADTRTRGAPPAAGLAGLGARAFIGIPVMRLGRPTAMFLAAHPEQRLWARHEVELIEQFTQRVWAAYERAQALELAAEREQALLESEANARAAAEELDQLYAKAPLGLALLDTDMRFVRINDALAQMNGIPPGRHIGKTVWDLLPDLRASAEPSLRRVIDTGEPLLNVPISGMTAAQPGVMREWVEQFYPFMNGRGEVTGIGILCEEVTERLRLERRIRDSEAHLRRVLDQLFAFVGTLTPDGVLVEANRAPIDAAGLAREDVIGRPFADAPWWSYDADIQARLRADIARAAKGETIRYDVPVAMANDTRMWIDFQLAPMHDDDGTITHLIASGVGIDARLEAESQLRALNLSLEERVRDEAARREATQVALMQAQKMEALGQLTSGIAHDFNNVIQAISSGFMLIKKRTDDPRIIEIADHSAKAAERGRSVVNQLLSFARQQPVEMREVDLGALLAETRPLLERTAGSRARLEIYCPDDIGHVRTDAGLLEAALINVVANARDAMPGGGDIVIGVHRADDEACVTIAVEDSGTGMAPEIIERVTEPFFTTKPQGKGTGLGLAMVHGFAEQCGGRLRIESTLGTGTMVAIDLPCPTDNADALPASAELSSSRTVLLVDDDDSVRVLAGMQLRELGYHVVEAEDGRAALDTFDAMRERGERIDLILSDVRMPNLDGPGFVREVRKREQLPVIFMTGFAQASEIEGEAILPKPFAETALIEALNAMLAGAD